ncbi:hypothetical protein PV05_09478 [Exophiala xenobiotica]|uniref:Uncharacterized protein n=1 Tax=Exophiala xenobiotica TaxID=348802 RepID=A0A0D2E7H2_9EURO|nr:uncharacterized protein PV05_09478 [Exophiala xenobiotica]KIW50690.1 hypothetical protein PV05_09478 [Exophiala xenobiotica]
MTQILGLLPFTFGVEIEVLFAIDQTKVENQPQYNYLRIENYQSDERDMLGKYVNKEDWLGQAATVLRRRGADLAILSPPTFIPEDDSDLFQHWVLTTECAVKFPKSDRQISAWSNDQIQDLGERTFVGLELISPILAVPDLEVSDHESESLAEVNQYLDILTRRSSARAPYHFIAGPKSTSVHVHVGLEPSENGQVALPLDIVRHLAWIVICFEDVFTLLHHPERHGYQRTKSDGRAKSNRAAYGREPGVTHHSCKTFSLIDAFLQIFRDEIGFDKYGKRWLGDMLSDRYCFVNFTNAVPLSHQTQKMTVEFRQHHGTLDKKDINEWILFVTAIIKTAERKANQGRQDVELPANLIQKVGAKRLVVTEMSKYAATFNSPRRTLKELFDLMELPIERRRYWWARARTFQTMLSEGRTVGQYKFQSCCSTPWCEGSTLRDCEGWKVGELDTQPWDEPQQSDSKTVEVSVMGVDADGDANMMD